MSTNSVLGRALSCTLRERWDGGYPILKQIEISYDLIFHHRESERPYGYNLNLDFVHETGQNNRRSICLTVFSAEDPPRDREGSEAKNWPRTRWTTLDNIRCWGSNKSSR